VLDAFLRRMIRVGRLSVSFDGAPPKTYGDGTGEEVIVRLTGSAARQLALNPGLALGETYMKGELVVEQGGIWGLCELIGRNYPTRPKAKAGLFKSALNSAKKLRQQWNDLTAARRNVAHHYDLSHDLYTRFLDADMQYSCAYFPTPDATLEEAQQAKKTHIAAKLNLFPGASVLDIGSGWGGMGLELARKYGADVRGVTLSTEQLEIAVGRAEAEGLADKARFTLTDYRELDGKFDRIVSVGMFEHVGAPNYRAFFQQVAKLLKDDGVAVIHSIGRMKGPGVTNPFTQKYIFPGAYVPALSEVMPAIEQAGLYLTDLEILRIHYAETLKHWRHRFVAHWDEAAALYDEQFCRMWEYYLAAGELAFRYGGHMVFQLQLAKRVGALPITRDYMIDRERAASTPPA
jgi:cyclopropane-fatty-acyl-phospholipid synthase